ncbi:DUF5696 domain-containing protein [Paenibacillus pasadenensis]|uniref:DUF5696 domain-containing protein n=1 Tax=Paenibacillus pasadenensis TaxID=217090 RepID=UPI00203F71F4|nr:DUF5696 domain-containing protein [Paenibacillus pasadenensis]MCM3749052.1 DUF5696 domain-containing protein [Paenibacillus pasadenensis]
MDKPIWKNRKVTITAAVAIVLLAVWLYSILSAPDLSGKVDFEPRKSNFMPVAQGTSLGSGAADAKGWTTIKENGRYALLLHEATGNVAVRDAETGFEWKAFATPEQLAKEKVSGLLRTNLESAFIMEYFTSSKIQRQIKNAKDEQLEVKYSRTETGFAADYHFKDIKIGFRMEYELTENGLKVNIPVESITEKAEFRLISIESLPFFGAAAPEAEAGYMFIPDGPGGLIRFPQKNILVGKGYEQPIYGPEYTGNQFPETNMAPLALPVFGMKQGDNAFVAIIDKGEFTAWIKAIPSGAVGTMNSVSAKFIYRQEYDRRLSLGGASVRAFQEQMTKQDRAVEYRFLTGDDADYVGMAQAYRKYMLDSEKITSKLEPVDHVPLDLTLIAGDSDWNGYAGYAPATTFPQAKFIQEDLKKSGVEAMNITYEAWLKDGSLSEKRTFSLEGKLGGDKALKSFVDSAHENGYKVMFQAKVTEADTEFVKHSPKTFGIRSIEGNVLIDGGWFWFNPNVAYNLTKNIGQNLKKFGVDGLQFDGIGSAIYRDYNPKYNFQREDTAQVFQQMQQYANEELGTNGVYFGNAYSLKYAKHIQGVPNDVNDQYGVDEMVPFMPIVLHGSISYNMGDGNVRNDYEKEFLKAIEYGAVPAFILTHESTRTLLDTYSWGVYSSRYEFWKDKLLKEYKDFDGLASTYDQPIKDHRQLSDNVFVTEYANGVSVTVDYNSKSFRVEKGGSR